MGAIERQLAGFAATLKADDLPRAQRLALTRLVEDVVACMVAGMRTPECREIARRWHSMHGASQASFVGTPTRGAWSDAAFVNAVAAHWFEWDDCYDDGGIHACAVIFPVVLAAAECAAAEERPASGSDFVAALAAAVDISCRLSRALTPWMASGWMPTGYAATIGAAAGAARLLGGTETQILNAMGLAASGVALSRQPIVDFVDGKNVLCGLAASRAAEAVRLAVCGVAGAPRFLTGRLGLNALLADHRADVATVGEGLGSAFLIDRVALKPYPCCRSTHPAIDLGIEWFQQGATTATVAGVEVSVAQPMADLCGAPFEPTAHPRVAAQFSIAYAVACAMTYGEMGLEHFTDQAVREDNRLMALARRVVTNGRPLGAGRKPLGEPTEMRVTTIDASTRTLETRGIRGDATHPLSGAERSAKFAACMKGGLSAARSDELKTAIDRIFSDGPLAVAALLRQVAGPHASSPSAPAA